MSKPKFRVGQVVVAKNKLTNSSGSLVRCAAGCVLRIIEWCAPHMPDIYVVQIVNTSVQFGTTSDGLRPLRPAKETKPMSKLDHDDDLRVRGMRNVAAARDTLPTFASRILAAARIPTLDHGLIRCPDCSGAGGTK